MEKVYLYIDENGKTKYVHVDENEKVKKVKSFVHTGSVKTKEWWNNNKQWVMVTTPIALTFVTTIVRGVNKKANLRESKRLKECYVYDRSLGHYLELKRKLTSQEWKIIDERKMKGEKLIDILNDLKVLK